ncbi:MAG: hypothetical protein IPM29_03830 [Planctomycetes bacterium]|nr:hypothetical protein [Planctomycetota bacterium]
MCLSLRVAISGAVLALTTVAQSTPWVVDSLGRPGSHFTSVQAAVQAAPPGQVLIVRAGTYVERVTIQRGVSLLAEPGTRIQWLAYRNEPLVQIANLPAGERVAIQNVTFGNGWIFGPAVQVLNCAGGVQLEDLVGDSTWLARTGTEVNALVDVYQSARVSLSGCRFTGGRPALAVVSSAVAADRCTLVGMQGTANHANISPGPGIAAIASTLALSGCTVRGGDFDGLSGPGLPAVCEPALRSYLTDWTITGTAADSLVAGIQPFAAQSAITGGGTVTIHPGVTLVSSGGAGPTSGVRVARAPIPWLAASAGAPGRPVTVELISTAGDTVLLLAGTLGAPRIVSSVGTLWLDPAAGPVLAASGTQPGSGVRAWTFPSPLDPALLGVQLTWQAWSGQAIGSGLLSNPSSYVHGW